MRRLAAAVLLLLPLALAAPRPAAATIAVSQYYTFLGTCTDCAGIGTGVLELTDYTQGAALNPINFLSFTYNSNLLSFHVEFPDLFAISGNLTTLPGQNTVSLAFDNVSLTYLGEAFSGQFVSFDSFALSGAWNVCAVRCEADFGPTHDWLVPEPASLALLGAGLLGLAGVRRRRGR